MRPIVIAGIGTNVGKTLVSSVLVEAFSADYWKPVQTGKKLDRHIIHSLTSVPKTYKEAFHFLEPCSPHVRGALFFTPPKTHNLLIIEGCGGVMTPLNKKDLLSEVFFTFNPVWILVSKNYLGSINHTLLAISYLKNRSQSILGLVFTGKRNRHTEEFILNYTKLSLLFRLPLKPRLTKAKIAWHAKRLKKISPLFGIPTRM